MLRIARYSDTENWGTTGQFFSVRPEYKGMRVLQYPALYPPQQALESYSTSGNWEAFKDVCRPWLGSRKPEIAKLVKDINSQRMMDLTFLVSDDVYERSYEWMIEQFLVKGFKVEGKHYKIDRDVLYVFNQEKEELCATTTTEVQEDKPKDSFVTLHIHSHYSDGSAKVPEIVQAAAEAGNPAIALTDHGTMMGAIDLIEACQKFGIKPIVGNEMYLEHPFSSIIATKTLEGLNGDYKPGNRFHQLVLAKTLEGYRNLSRLTTWSELENKKSSGKGKAYPLITFEKLKQYAEGLIVTSGCIGSLVPQLIIFGERELAEQVMREYKEVFGEDYYVELQHHDAQDIYIELNNTLVELAQKLGIEVVISPDTHYLKECHYEVHSVLYAIKYGKRLSELKQQSFQYDRDLFFTGSQELRERFWYLDDAVIDQGLANTVKIAEKVDQYELFRAPTAPEFPLPAGVTAEEHLRALAEEGLRGRFKDAEVPEGYDERLAYELGVIHDMGFDSYFLIVHDYIAFAKAQGIPTGMGRGSAAGSLVAYALGITGVDPIHHGLLFERFLNPERKSMPDIDSDFCQERRGEVIDYVIRKYGRDRVAQIGTVNTLSSKAVVKDVGRVLDIPIGETDAASKMIPVTRGKPTKLAKMISDESPCAEFRDKYRGDAQFKRWIDLAIALEGNMKTYGTHAAGVVIADISLSDLVPLMSNDGVICTQYTMEQVEKLGFLKMDFLGLKTLSVLNAAARAAEANKGITIDLERIDRADSRVFEVFKRVDLEGVFQFESSLFQSLSQQLQADSLEDISSINALARPGALDTGMTAKFVESKKDLSKIHYDHPDLEPLLNMTYGQAIYQEQILKIVQDIGGFSLGEADLVRRACGKKKADVMKGYEDKFMAGCVAQGYSEELGHKLWEYILASAEYIFNKSHSMAYGYTAYDCAWFKTYHRAEFMAALVSYEKKREKISRYLNSSKRHGIEILPPDINLSGLSFTPKDNKILFGLKAVKGLGDAGVEAIVTARQEALFESLVDFYLRTNLGVGGMQALAKAGAFDSLYPNRKQLVESIPLLKKWRDDFAKIPERVARIEESIQKRCEKLKIDISLEAIDNYEKTNAPLNKTKTADVKFVRRKFAELDQVRSQQSFHMVEAGADFSLEDKLRQEQESIGFFVSGNPVESLLEFDLFPATTEIEADDEELEATNDYKKWIKASCAIVEREDKVSKAGNPYSIMLLEDHAGTALKCFAYAQKLEEYGHMLDGKLAFTGKFRVDKEDDGFKLILNEVIP